LTDVAKVGATTQGKADGKLVLPCSSTTAIEVDGNICCFATGKLYTEALLGVGVSREKKNLGTAAELLSKEAFDGGLRQSTNKSPFEFFSSCVDQ